MTVFRSRVEYKQSRFQRVVRQINDNTSTGSSGCTGCPWSENAQLGKARDLESLMSVT